MYRAPHPEQRTGINGTISSKVLSAAPSTILRVKVLLLVPRSALTTQPSIVLIMARIMVFNLVLSTAYTPLLSITINSTVLQVRSSFDLLSDTRKDELSLQWSVVEVVPWSSSCSLTCYGHKRASASREVSAGTKRKEVQPTLDLKSGSHSELATDRVRRRRAPSCFGSATGRCKGSCGG